MFDLKYSCALSVEYYYYSLPFITSLLHYATWSFVFTNFIQEIINKKKNMAL